MTLFLVYTSLSFIAHMFFFASSVPVRSSSVSCLSPGFSYADVATISPLVQVPPSFVSHLVNTCHLSSFIMHHNHTSFNVNCVFRS